MKTMARTGYVDAHAHITGAGGLDDVAAAGVAAVRDAGAKNGAGLGIIKEEYEGRVVVVSAGRALYRSGGYGSRFGVPVGTRDEIRSEILTLSRAKAGIIKVMASGVVSLKKPGELTPGGFPAEDLAFIVEEAARSGLGVMAHANGEAAILEAAGAGVRSVEHGFFMTERALAALADRRIFWVPTVAALERAAKAEGASEHARTFVESLIRSHLDMIKRAWSIGVPLAVGSDGVLPDPRYREAYERELGYFEQAGIPRDEVMKIACEGGKKLLGL